MQHSSHDLKAKLNIIHNAFHIQTEHNCVVPVCLQDRMEDSLNWPIGHMGYYPCLAAITLPGYA